MARESKQNVAFLLHRAVLALQAKARKARLKSATRVDPLLSNYLPVMLPHLPMPVEDIATMFSMQKEQFLALISVLEQQGILARARDSMKRETVDISAAGRTLVPTIIAADKEIEEEMLRGFDSNERQRMSELFGCLNDNFAILPERALDGESNFVGEQKTFARASGMLGQDYLSSGFDIGAIHLFEHLLDNGGFAFRVIENERLPLSRENVVSLIASLKERGILAEDESPAALGCLALTAPGQKTAFEARSSCVATLGLALEGMGAESALELSALFFRAAESAGIVGQ